VMETESASRPIAAKLQRKFTGMQVWAFADWEECYVAGEEETSA
jgi:hypothetical protein